MNAPITTRTIRYYTLFTKTDSNGDVLWRKRENGISSIQATSDGGHIIVRGNRLVKLGGKKPDQTHPAQEQPVQPANITPAISHTPGFDWIFAARGILIAVYFVLRRKQI